MLFRLDYVAAIWKAPHPLHIYPGAALSLWVSLWADIRLTALVQTGSVVGDHWTDAAIRTGGGTIQRSALRPGDRGPVCALVSEF